MAGIEDLQHTTKKLGYKRVKYERIFNDSVTLKKYNCWNM